MVEPASCLKYIESDNKGYYGGIEGFGSINTIVEIASKEIRNPNEDVLNGLIKPI